MNHEQQVEILTLPSGEPMPDGEVIIYRHFFKQSESDQFFDILFNSLNWRQEKIKFFGKEINIPRLTAWYGDEGKSYQYSGIKMNPNPWTPSLIVIKSEVETVLKLKFNSVLINLYRQGQDSMGWHSDDERELGQNPTIASVSFGATRRFQLRHKSNKTLNTLEVALTHGSLLLMRGKTQHFWKHQIPKTSKTLTPRINLTFRAIK
ncbi:MAG: alpha-ketoglutarate-dependent dioxygenase AlkB family protein [Waterburya sp.]